ncbi:unnamed protein product [Ceratitis capitata]|uniref:(Mediterranean fruit fly) hypothetical protein n=1 Tax=Ceratitis capitata TaxID=7213 RepID=A0A811VER4_CERCA|nr:unnamed protein product [Ceratitis capitata]
MDKTVYLYKLTHHSIFATQSSTIYFLKSEDEAEQLTLAHLRLSIIFCGVDTLNGARPVAKCLILELSTALHGNKLTALHVLIATNVTTKCILNYIQI